PVTVRPDVARLYALSDRIETPPTAVSLDATAVDGEPHVIPSPGQVGVPGRLEELNVTIDDGTTVHAWLALPEGAEAGAPAPMLLWIHGGPLNSWNAWAWRWNPW